MTKGGGTGESTGIKGVEAGRETINALVVRAAASKLGIPQPARDAEGEEPSAHRLYQRLNDELGDGAHSRYNAILARVASSTEQLGFPG